MRLSSRQRQYLSHLGVDVWYQKQPVDTANHRWTVSVTTSGSRDHTWLWLSDAADLSVEQSALLCKIQQAVGATATSVTSMTFTEIQQLMPIAVVFLGHTVAQSLHVPAASGVLTSPVIGQHELVTVSLQDMLDSPTNKREVWHNLQALQAACAATSQ